MSDDAKGSDDGVTRHSLAEDRTILAAERTFASWLRTGVAFLGTGLAAQRFLQETLASWQLKVLVFTLILCALASFAAAAWRDERVRRRIPQPEIQLPPRVMTLGVASLLAALAVFATVALALR